MLVGYGRDWTSVNCRHISVEANFFRREPDNGGLFILMRIAGMVHTPKKHSSSQDYYRNLLSLLILHCHYVRDVLKLYSQT